MFATLLVSLISLTVAEISFPFFLLIFFSSLHLCTILTLIFVLLFTLLFLSLSGAWWDRAWSRFLMLDEALVMPIALEAQSLIFSYLWVTVQVGRHWPIMDLINHLAEDTGKREKATIRGDKNSTKGKGREH